MIWQAASSQAIDFQYLLSLVQSLHLFHFPSPPRRTYISRMLMRRSGIPGRHHSKMKAMKKSTVLNILNEFPREFHVEDLIEELRFMQRVEDNKKLAEHRSNQPQSIQMVVNSILSKSEPPVVRH